MTHQPDLGITDPYALTEEQLNAAVELLQGQSTLIDKYWASYVTEIDGFVDGSMVAGTAWPVNLSYAELDAPVAAAEPTEGMTGWADTWMMSSSAPHPNCMLEWMDYSLGADVQAETAEYYGAAASNTAACPILRESLDTQFDFGDAVDTVRYGYCGDADFLESLWLWRTPQTPTDYSIWVQKWTEIGARDARRSGGRRCRPPERTLTHRWLTRRRLPANTAEGSAGARRRSSTGTSGPDSG